MTPFDPITLETDRLTLRFLTEADAPALFAIFSHPEVMRYWSTPPYTELDQAREMQEGVAEGYRDGSALCLGIERREDHALLGTCTLFQFHRSCRRAEIGYALGRDFWGEGYMQEALKAFIAHGFQELDLHRIEADIDPRNTASARVLERFGFQKEGHLRERWIVADEVSDSWLYGLLRWEWEGRPAAD